jgi:hypothetical protein
LLTLSLPQPAPIAAPEPNTPQKRDIPRQPRDRAGMPCRRYVHHGVRQLPHHVINYRAPFTRSSIHGLYARWRNEHSTEFSVAHFHAMPMIVQPQ